MARWIGVIMLCTVLGFILGGVVGFILASYGSDYVLIWYIEGDWGDATAPMDMALGKCATSGAVLGTVSGMVVVIADAIYKSHRSRESK